MAALDEYETFCAGIRRLAGVDLSQYKRQQMERRIRTYVSRSDAKTSLAEFLRSIEKDRGALDAFLDRITINVSELYRNPEQWDLLRSKVIPDLRTATIKIWSAGCSYGAEAFTLASLCADMGRGFQILGTDIDPRIVARAQRGWFSDSDMRNVPPKTKARYFREANGGWEAVSDLKRHTTFRVADLLRMRYEPGWDLVLCRNVVIYFNDEARDHVHTSIAGALKGGGYFMVGSTERVANAAGIGLTTAHPFIYRKVG